MHALAPWYAMNAERLPHDAISYRGRGQERDLSTLSYKKLSTNEQFAGWTVGGS